MKIFGVLLAGLLLTGCATLPTGKPDPRDPWERINRSSFAFNDALDRAIAKPVAKAYKKVTPQVIRTGVSNFMSNIDTVTTIVNDALQGKVRQAGHDSARFLLNSTVGLAGLFDPASMAGLERNDEDFGQTLGKWGVKAGPYLMLPFLGPSTVRDSLGGLVDQYDYPVNYLEDDSTRLLIRGVNFLDMRTGLLDLDAQFERSYDKYAFMRNAWLQRREFQVTDGNVSDASLELEEGMEEEPPPADSSPESTPDSNPAQTPPDAKPAAPPPAQPAPAPPPPK